MANIVEAATHIDLSERRFRELLDTHVLTRRSPGKYDLNKVRVEYIRHLRAVAAGRGADGDLDLSEERAKLARAQTEATELKLAVAKGDYVPRKMVIAVMQRIVLVVRERLLGFPGEMSDRCAFGDPERRVLIHGWLHEKITEILHNLAKPATFDFGSVEEPEDDAETDASAKEQDHE